MDPVEKFDRLINPKSAADYGLSMTGAEVKAALETKLQDALNEQKRWEDFDPAMAAFHEGRADVLNDALAALVRATSTATESLKAFGVAVGGITID